MNNYSLYNFKLKIMVQVLNNKTYNKYLKNSAKFKIRILNN